MNKIFNLQEFVYYVINSFDLNSNTIHHHKFYSKNGHELSLKFFPETEYHSRYLVVIFEPHELYDMNDGTHLGIYDTSEIVYIDNVNNFQICFFANIIVKYNNCELTTSHHDLKNYNNCVLYRHQEYDQIPIKNKGNNMLFYKEA